MKLLMVTDTLLTGGAELFALRLCRALVQRGIEAHFLCLSPEHVNAQLAGAFKDLQIYYGPPVPFHRTIDRIDRGLLRLGLDVSLKYRYKKARLDKRFLSSYTHVHTHLFHVDLLFAQLKEEGLSFRHITTIHGDYSAEWNLQTRPERHYVHVPQKLQTIRSSVNHWVLLSEEQRVFFARTLNWTDLNVTKIYNGVARSPDNSLPESHARADRRFTIGMVARGVRQKGWTYLVDAFLQLRGHCRLVLTGEGECLDALEAEHGKNPNILFTHFHPHPLQLMQDFDVFVLPTIFPFESLPSVVAEALTCGVPVIATDVGEIRSMLQDEAGAEAGFLLYFDGRTIRVEQLRKYLQAFHDDPALLDEMKQRARRAAEKFSMEACVAAYVDVYTGPPPAGSTP